MTGKQYITKWTWYN